MNNEDEYLPSWNGHRGTPQDKLAKATWWFLGLIALGVFAVGLTQAIEYWWK